MVGHTVYVPTLPHDLTTAVGTDHCCSEEYRCTHVDVCGKNLNIVSICVNRGTHIEHLQLSKKKNSSVFLWL
jgi:hypothetical protein